MSKEESPSVADIAMKYAGLVSQAAANKAAEEGGLPELPELAEEWILSRGITYSKVHMIDYARSAIAADRASRQVANKAEVDLSDDEIFNFWLHRDCMLAIQAGDMKAQFVSAVRALLATPTATTGASTVDEPQERSLKEIMADSGRRSAATNAVFDMLKGDEK